MKNTASSIRCQRVKGLACSFGFLLLLALSEFQVMGQEAPPMALAPGTPAGSYALSDIDSVNLFNGRVNVHLPLFNIAGRGGAKSKVSVTIDSPFPYKTGIYDDGGGTPYQFVEPGMTSDGVHMGQYSLRSETSGGNVQLCYPGEPWAYWKWMKTLTRVYLIEPDGTEHEMRDELTGGQPLDGTPGYCPLGPTFPGPYRGHKFVSTDGSGITLLFDTGLRDSLKADAPYPLGGGGATILFKDGRQIVSGDGTGILGDLDRNGNKLEANSDSLNRQTYEEVATSLEQCVTLFGGTPRGCSAIVQKGFGGALRKVWISVNDELRVSGILLPNGQRYSFFYNQYGDLIRLDLPTGGSIEYDFEPGLEDTQVYCGLYQTPCMPGTYSDFVYNRVVARRVYREGHVLETRQTFSKPGGNGTNVGYVDQKTYDGSNHLLNLERHFFHGTAEGSFAIGPLDYPGWKTGKEYRTEIYDGVGNLLRTTETTWAQRELVSWWPGDQDYAPQNDSRVATVVNTLENGLSSTTGYTYDPTVPYNSLTDVHVYDYGGALLRHTNTIYLKNQSGMDYSGSNIPNAQYAGALHLRDFPLQVSVRDGVKELSRTSYEYDNYSTASNHASLLPRSNISGLEASFTASYQTRGNVTGTTSYLIESGVVTGSASSYTQYDVAGNMVKAIDPRGFATEYFYDDHFGAPDGDVDGNTVPSELSTPGQASFAFVTKVKNAANHISNTQFDYYLGQAVDARDANGVVSSAYFTDVLGRPTQVIHAVNKTAPIKNQSVFSYDDVSRTVTTTSDLDTYNDNLLKQQTVYDGLGRTVETRTYENSSQYLAVKTIPFVALQDPDTNTWVAATQTSNPFRQSEQPIWTTNFLDPLGRTSKLRTPDTAIIRTYYDGARTLVVDQIGKERLSRTNALGEVKDVWEVKPADAETEAVSFPGRSEVTAGYHTAYEYDALSQLTKVTQGTQSARLFAYDTLGRLIATTNPENGTVSYQQDASGNITVKTDARGVSAHYSYDELNRLVRRWYNGSSATSAITHNVPALPAGVGVSEEVKYWYDAQTLPGGAPSFSRGAATGRLVATTYGNASSAGDYLGYDAGGRTVLKIQLTGGVNYQVTAARNVSGRITSEVYPSGHTVSYDYDGAGRVLGFAGNLGVGTQRNYATGSTYSPLGGLSQEQFGTAIPIYNKLFYNVRGQLSEIREGTTPNNTDFERGALINFYSGCWGMCADTPMPDNNGNLKRQEHWVKDAGGAVIAVNSEAFEYDSLNRLTRVYEGSAAQPAWQQSYLYDRFGNRRLDVNATTASLSPREFEVQAATNRLQAPGDSNLAEANRQMRYDAAGNLTSDNYTGQGQRIYDAENHITQAWAGGQWQSYTYDATGQRVRRNVSGAETWQVYGIGGELLAEYAANDPATTPQKEYGYRNGALLIVAGTGTATAPAPSSLAASPSAAGGNVVLSWSAASGAVKYRVERKGATGSFVLAGTSASTGLTDTGASPGSAYLYRVCAANAQNACVSVFSNIALGAAVSFPTDPTITSSAEDPSGVNVTKVKAAHILELRTAVNAVRSLAGLPVGQWTHQTITPQASFIYAADVRDLRLALHDALLALGMQTSDYEDQTLNGAPNGTAIKKVHITQLRQRATSGTGGAGGSSPNQFGVQWLVTDQLGTPRIVFDETGSLSNVKRHDYLPFGEDLVAGARATTPGYGLGDGVRQKFTQYERDEEIELDYAHARYYSSNQGRFTGVDPIAGQPPDPQTWNRYAYVGNNPVNLTDPTGMNYFMGGGTVDPGGPTEYMVDGFYMGPEGTNSQLTSESMLSYAPNQFLMNEGATSGGGGSTEESLDNPYELTATTADGTITVAFSGSYDRGMANGPGDVNTIWGPQYGLGFTVYGSVNSGGIGHIGSDAVAANPNGAWTVQQFVSAYKKVNGEVTNERGGNAHQELHSGVPHSVNKNEFRYWDHPGISTSNLRDYTGKYNFTAKLVSGSKQIEIKFHVLITYSNGVGSARWGAGQFKN